MLTLSLNCRYCPLTHSNSGVYGGEPSQRGQHNYAGRDDRSGPILGGREAPRNGPNEDGEERRALDERVAGRKLLELEVIR